MIATVHASQAPMTGAERQRRFRERHAERVATLERENAELRAEVERLGRLASAVAEVGRWTHAASVPACQHPSAAVVDSVCQSCGADVD